MPISALGNAGVGCICALALWKATQERWVPALVGLMILVATFSFADKADFPFDLLIYLAGFGTLNLGDYGLEEIR